MLVVAGVRRRGFPSWLSVSWRNRYHGLPRGRQPCGVYRSGSAMNEDLAETTPVSASWWQRLRTGLQRSSSALGGAIADLAKRPLDAAAIEEIEDELIRADLGVETSARIAQALSHGRFNTSVSADEIKEVVAAEVEKALASVAVPLLID